MCHLIFRKLLQALEYLDGHNQHILFLEIRYTGSNLLFAQSFTGYCFPRLNSVPGAVPKCINISFKESMFAEHLAHAAPHWCSIFISWYYLSCTYPSQPIMISC